MSPTACAKGFGKGTVMTDRAALKRRFTGRMLLLGVVWLLVLGVARTVDTDHAFGALIVLLAWAIPVASPLIAWLDWRWLSTREGGA